MVALGTAQRAVRSRKVREGLSPPTETVVCVSLPKVDFDTVLHVREEVCEQLDAWANCPDEADMTCCNDDSGENGSGHQRSR